MSGATFDPFIGGLIGKQTDINVTGNANATLDVGRGGTLATTAFSTPTRLKKNRIWYAPLINSLAPTIGTTPVNFSRAATNSGGTFKNSDGNWVPVLPGEAAFLGARRVANLNRVMDFSTWTVGSSTTKTLHNQTSQNFPGRSTLYQFARASGSVAQLIWGSLISTMGAVQHILSFDIDGRSNTASALNVIITKTTGSVVVQTTTITPIATGIYRYSVPFTPQDNTAHTITITGVAAAYTLVIGDVQIEEAFGKTAICSEPIASDTDYNAGLPGVAYFIYANPMQFVTAKTPNAVYNTGIKNNYPLSQFLGLHHFPTFTNKIANPDITTWAKNAATTPTTKTSIFGPATLAKLATDGTSAEHNATVTYTSNTGPLSATIGVTLYVHAQAAELSWIYLELYNGTGIIGTCYFDTSTGTIGTYTGTYCQPEVALEAPGLYRCSITVNAGSTTGWMGAAYSKVGLASGDGGKVFTGTAGQGVWVGAPQLEMNAEMPLPWAGKATTLTIVNGPIATIPPTAEWNTANPAIAFTGTPLFFTGSVAASNWRYWVYRKDASGLNKDGMSIRPGTKAGQTGQEGVIAWDVYSANWPAGEWNGVDTKQHLTSASASAYTTHRYAWSITDNANYNGLGSGYYAVADGVPATEALTSTTHGTYGFSVMPTVYLGGGQSPGSGMSNLCIRDLTLFSSISKEDMQIA